MRYSLMGVGMLVALAGLPGCEVHHHHEPPPAVAAPAWVLLATRTVDFHVDRDVFDLGHRGPYRALQLQVGGGPVEIYNMRITFADGSVYDAPLRYTFSPRNPAHVIDLPGHRRVIRGISFAYRSLDRRTGRATVAVYAQ